MSGHSAGMFSGGGLIRRDRQPDDAEFDITAMIDLVFMMNIYFMVTFITAAMGELPNLPNAVHAAPLDLDDAIQITVLESPDPNFVTIQIGGEGGDRLKDPVAQEEAIAKAVEEGVAQNKKKVLLRAQQGVRLREINRIAGSIGAEGVSLHIAVMETEAKHE
ncbi:ExbD/TolR family protein [Anatilimnocola sp. NA78]|uniref:ExbD/TolR family protein n=1 Tax=Anatilimnocola sp. NA78 TaxID=3415683 RepID=UPI003CE54D54